MGSNLTEIKKLQNKEIKTDIKRTRLPTLTKRYTLEQIAAAIRKNYGTLTYTCLDLDCSIQQLEYTFRKYPQLQEVRQEARASIIDLAEKKIVEAMESGNINAVLYTLKTLGSKRGWQENQKVEVAQLTADEQKRKIEEIFGLSNNE